VFKSKDPQEQARRDADKAAAQAERERQAFLGTPVGRARAAFDRGDVLFQYTHDVESQDAVIVAMVGSATTRRSSDPTEILNAVAHEGWSLVTASFVFREQGSQSRDKFLSSGQNIAVKGTTLGYYVFERRESLRSEA
jgi:hypothetical protein